MHDLKRNLIQLPVITSLLFMCVCGCKNERQVEPGKVERSIYYWKTTLDLKAYELQFLDTHQVQTIYLRFFDVDYDRSSRKPVPVGTIRSEETSLRLFRSAYAAVRIIPTIFITEECMRFIDSSQIKQLANDMHKLTMDILASNGFKNIPEMQFDCDWNQGTREKYFLLLKKFHELMPQTPMSATIRLHQVKFSARTGIPPVDRGLLMLYNMGNLRDPSAENSILEVKELKKYISNLKSYPLPLDVALPLFEWSVLFRDNAFRGLIYNFNDVVPDNGDVRKIRPSRIQFTRDTTINGYHFLKGDILRHEKSNVADIINAAMMVKNKLKKADLRLALFHLDSVILRKYTFNEMESIYNSLH